MSINENHFPSKTTSMGILEISLISFLVTLHSPVFCSGNDEHCSNFSCGSDPTFVRYPFKFLNQSKKECGVPGFDVGCDSGEDISLNLPNSGKFYVEYIDYYNQGIQLRDPQGCLPGRLLKLSNSSNSSPFSPFSGDYFYNYTFFQCRNYSNLVSWESPLPIIYCMSNSDVLVIASSSSDMAADITSTCNRIGTVAVPHSQAGGTANIAAADFTLSLSWKDPECLHCTSRGGFCRFAGKTVCTINEEASSQWKRWEKFLRIVGFSIFLPLAILPVLFLTVLLFFGGIRGRRNLAGSSRALRVAEMIRQLTAKPGLDERVIESYPKMVVDERLGNVGRDVLCCICLDEYVTGEMLRSLPECRHCFHVECIDEWLKINRTCPICRI